MKVVLISVGTRGDMEPFLALAWLLKSKGHSVVCIFLEQFKSLVEEVEVEFLSLGSDFIDLLESREGKLVMGGRGSLLHKVQAYVALYRKSLIINRDMVDSQIQYLDQLMPDRVVYNGKSTGPLVWGSVLKGKSIILSPVPYLIHAVDNHPHIGVKWSWGRVFNRWTYTLANFAFVQNILSTTKGVRQQLDVGRK
ncbi:MAG: hypothetical protein HKN87_15735 [Saprospiraceae bacterium]|nr:hypothetical protein [Saprospiraceae bacterium]